MNYRKGFVKISEQRKLFSSESKESPFSLDSDEAVAGRLQVQSTLTSLW